MGIDINTIRDPRQRARYEEALRSGSGSSEPHPPCTGGIVARPARLISQSHKPVLNKLETAALAWLQEGWPSYVFHKQALRFKLANGSWYKPDLEFFADTGRLACYEVKELRGKNAARGILALKAAAYQFPEVRWHLLVRQKGVWREQEVLA
jgi:hypothetical protein